jgi:hypothetical protein
MLRLSGIICETIVSIDRIARRVSAHAYYQRPWTNNRPSLYARQESSRLQRGPQGAFAETESRPS